MVGEQTFSAPRAKAPIVVVGNMTNRGANSPLKVGPPAEWKKLGTQPMLDGRNLVRPQCARPTKHFAC